MLHWRLLPVGILSALFVVKAYFAGFLAWSLAPGVPILGLVSWFFLLQSILLVTAGLLLAPAEMRIAGRTLRTRLIVPGIIILAGLILFALAVDLIWNYTVHAAWPNTWESHFLVSFYELLV